MTAKTLFSAALSILISLLIVNHSANASESKTRIAIASNFSSTAMALIKDFETRPDHSNFEILPAFASSGKLYAQIRHGAPFDILLSADQDKPTRLIENGLAVESSRFSYAIGQLVLMGAYSSIDQLKNSPGDFISMLNTIPTKAPAPEQPSIAIANPKFAPYGNAASEVLSQSDLCELKNSSLTCESPIKLIQGENVAQAFQFIHSGAVQLGFAAKSQLESSNSYIPVPQSLYSEIKQDAVLLHKGENNPAAIAFLGYLRSESARQIIRQRGYKIHAAN